MRATSTPLCSLTSLYIVLRAFHRLRLQASFTFKPVLSNNVFKVRRRLYSRKSPDTFC